MTFNRNKQLGLSLVELMVALGLSSVLLVGLFQIFNSNKQAFSLQDGVARVQESGRISMEFLSRNIRAASFLGCASGEESSPFFNSVDTSLYTNVPFRTELALFTSNIDGVSLNSIDGFENITGAVARLNNMGISINGTNAQSVVAGTDAFILHSVEACPGNQGRVTATTTGSVTVSGSCGLIQNDIAVASSCSKAEMFAVTSDPTATTVFSRGDSHNDGSTFDGGAFSDEGTYLYLPTITAFHVGHTGTGDSALYMTSINRNGTATSFQTQEIARGVYDMQVLYGEDTNDDGTVNRYVDADDVTSFEDVIAIRTQLQTRSQDRISVESQTYTFNNANVTDNRLRIPYQTTNTIRNRVN